MKSIQLKLKTVTPMFLHGYHNRILDLRPPPFKALFRYWWRATRAVTDLHKEEGKLFGNTRRKSPIQIRIPCSENLETDDYRPLPHHDGGKQCANCRQTNKECKQAYKNKAYCPDEQFTIILTADNIGCYEKIAKLGFLLGGVGNRSRRGFGSICDTNWGFTDIPNLRKEILQTLNDVAGSGHFVISPGSNSITSHLGSPRYPVIQEISFGQPTKNFQSLLRKIGQATHDHCDEALGSANPRMASPIHVRIQKVGGQFVPIVTQLNSVFPGAAPHNYQQKQQYFINAILT